MELREWLIILGLALVTIIVIDGIRRLQRQRRVPRLDQVDTASTDSSQGKAADPEQEARDAEINWELPNGGARVIRPATQPTVVPKPKLERQDHPGPSKVLAGWRRDETEGVRFASTSSPPGRATTAGPAQRATAASTATPATGGSSAGSGRTDSGGNNSSGVAASETGVEASSAASPSEAPSARQAPPQAPERRPQREAEPTRSERPETPDDDRLEPTLSAVDEAPSASAEFEGLAADPEDHHHEDHDPERYRIVDFDGMGDSLRSHSTRVGASVQRFGASLQKNLSDRKEQRRKEKLERERQKAERKAREASRRQQAEREAEQSRLAAEEARREQDALAAQEQDDPLFAPRRRHDDASMADEVAYDEAVPPADDRDEVVTPHPVVQKAMRHDVSAAHARDTLSEAEEVIVISVMSRDEEGFSGAVLLDLMLACGLRYSSEMGIFHRFETEDPHSELQFSMVNVVKPGIFPLDAMDDFTTPGITLLMPLPGATDTAAAFEAMFETAMVVVRNLGGELKDENRSVMTAQTVEFARQRVQEFERRHRLHRYQAN